MPRDKNHPLPHGIPLDPELSVNHSKDVDAMTRKVTINTSEIAVKMEN